MAQNKVFLCSCCYFFALAADFYDATASHSQIDFTVQALDEIPLMRVLAVLSCHTDLSYCEMTLGHQ